MTEKERALAQSIENALKNHHDFCLNGNKLRVLSISQIEIQLHELYPLKKIDVSNLEECKGGLFNASLRITCEIRQDDDISSCESCCRIECVKFEVKEYKNDRFWSQIFQPIEISIL